MSSLDHWHPVFKARKLRDKPVGIKLDGHEIVLFRNRNGVGALRDCCPHRRMRLSLGSVVDERLRCQYHGWTFDCAGGGESPGTPKLHAQVESFETCERHGWIWLRNSGSHAAFPEFDVEGFKFVGSLRHEMAAALEIVLDNFTEVEHTPTTHALLGYDLERMAEVETKIECSDTSVRVFNGGPQKRISPIIEFLFGIKTGDRFVDDWTTYFSPVYTCYDQYWSDAATLEPKGARWRIYVFFNPIEAHLTELVTFPFIQTPPEGGWRNWLLFKRSLTWLVDREVKLDKAMVESLADKRPEIDGMKLSRFDKTLGLHRIRLNRIYRGTEAQYDPDDVAKVAS